MNMETITKSILLSGSSISPLEIYYAADAALTGWNEKCFDYLKRFEATVCKTLGVKYAIATPSCTAALHLALLTIGVGPGDEVILPDSTWVASANPVAYTGATPVFVDVCGDDWTIDPEAVRRAVTPKTKAIIPVHLYGHPCKMDELNAIAREFGLYVIEDAAESMGSLYHGIPTGALGDLGCFIFHGSKTVVMGEGGVFTTNDENLYARAKFLGDQAKHPSIRFYSEEVGYKFRLSNLQAAFGLGQMERLEEIVAKKRQVFQWYQDELEGIKGLTLNPELPGIRNNFWMVTPVLGEKFPMGAAQVLLELEKRAVSPRPFFYPCTELPIYQSYRRAPTPVAHRLHERAFNLPSGAEMTWEEVRYVCAHLRQILTGKVEANPATGWLARREEFLRIRDNFPGVELVNPDFKTMDCEIVTQDMNQLTEKLLEEIHKACGFRRLFVRQFLEQGAECARPIQLGFVEHQRLPMARINGEWVPLLLQPYEEAQAYEVIFSKTFL